MKSYFMRAACFCFLSLATTTCGEDFPPYSRLEGLRVLAIQSEPVAPAYGETTTLTPLVFANPGETISYAWSWCPVAGPAGQNAPCLVTEAALVALIAERAGPEVAAAFPPYNLGTGATATFTNPFPTALLDILCANQTENGAAGVGDAGAGDAGAGASVAPALPFVFKCPNGFPIQIKMVATTATDTVTTVRALDLAYKADAPFNSNPLISDLTMQLLKRSEDRDPKVKEDQFDGPAQQVLESGAAVATRQREMRLSVTVPLASSEPFIDKDENDNDAPSKERLRLSWFVDSGDVKDARTGFNDGKTALDEALKNIWRPSSVKKFAGTKSKVVVVVRDNRGGVAWTWGATTLVEAAP